MRAVPTISQSPTAPDFVANPYQFYAKIRALGDFVYWEDYSMVMATSHEAVMAVLTSPAMGREMPADRRKARPDHLATHNKLDDLSLLRLEPPEHTRLRDAVANALDDEVTLQMAAPISKICDDLISAFPKNTPFDLQAAFADKVPGIVLMRFLGLPDDACMPVQQWARDMDALMHARRDRAIEDAAERAAVAFREMMQVHLSARRDGPPKDDFLGRLLGAQTSDQALSSDEVIALVLLCVQASIEGLAYTIGNSAVHLAGFPERNLALSTDHITETVEECVRMEPPLHIIGRHAQDRVTILDHEFERKDQVGCLLACASHDDAVWPDGDTFDPFRASRRNVGFGAGIHACVGGSLARMILNISLPSLFSRCPNLRLVKKVTYANDYLFRRPKALMVKI